MRLHAPPSQHHLELCLNSLVVAVNHEDVGPQLCGWSLVIARRAELLLHRGLVAWFALDHDLAAIKNIDHCPVLDLDLVPIIVRQPGDGSDAVASLSQLSKDFFQLLGGLRHWCRKVCCCA